MALVPPPANDRKRVKVYELKNNDWFDRGTGFCRGIVVSVRLPTASARDAARHGAMPSGVAIVALCSADLCDHRQRKRRLSYYPKTTRRASFSRRASPRMMAIRNSKVRRAKPAIWARKLISNRHAHSMDGAKWHRHGPQLPGARGLREYMVCKDTHRLTDNTLTQDRDFVNEVQSRLQALAQGRWSQCAHPLRVRLIIHR
jgi:hypothetical protein